MAVVKPPELRVVLWHSAPYAVYGMAYFVMILVGPLVVGFAYGRSLGVDQYVYPSTYEGSVDLALLELVVLLGLVYASIERFGRRLRPLLERPDPRLLAAGRVPPSGGSGRCRSRCWRRCRGLVAWVLPDLLLRVLPAALTASVRTPGGLTALEVASFGFALVPVGMLCSQYLFFLSRPRAPVVGGTGRRR